MNSDSINRDPVSAESEAVDEVLEEERRERESLDVFRRILVPIDFSPGSRKALLFALALRQRFGGDVLLMNVAGPSDGDDFLGGLGAPWNAGDIADEASDQLQRFAEHVAPGAAPTCSIDIESSGDIAAAVRDAAEKHRATLVVLAKTERRRAPLFRTRGERIASRLCCAVMFVPCEREVSVARD